MRRLDRQIYKILLNEKEDIEYCIKHTELRLHNLKMQQIENEIELNKFKERIDKDDE